MNYMSTLKKLLQYRQMEKQYFVMSTVFSIYFIVYINIENGREEKVFMVLDTPGGTFTI